MNLRIINGKKSADQVKGDTQKFDFKTVKTQKSIPTARELTLTRPLRRKLRISAD